MIVHYKISDLYRALDLPIAQELDFSFNPLHEIHKEFPFSSPTFRADYFSFVFIKQGYGAYTIDGNRFAFNDRTVYFTNPGHIKSFDIANLNEGYIVTFTEEFLKKNVHNKVFDEFPFLLAEIVPPVQLEPKAYAELERLYLNIREQSDVASQYQERILGNLFVVVLLKIKEQFWSGYNPVEEGSRSSRIVKNFKKALEKSCLAINNPRGLQKTLQVQDIADQLNLHPNYLNTVIKSKTGRTATDWINKKVFNTAQALLVNTDLSVKEIAYRTGYSEATHFSRIFKKVTGSSPVSYRRAAKI